MNNLTPTVYNTQAIPKREFLEEACGSFFFSLSFGRRHNGLRRRKLMPTVATHLPQRPK
jgi:hypothetical protein